MLFAGKKTEKADTCQLMKSTGQITNRIKTCEAAIHTLCLQDYKSIDYLCEQITCLDFSHRIVQEVQRII